jgi:hypothetical protein
MAPLVWLLGPDAIRYGAGRDAYLIRPATLLREWCALTAEPGGRRQPTGMEDPWEEVRHILLAIYPTVVGQN